MGSNRISHSAISTYLTCGKKYKLHYLDKLRGNTTSGALLMGTACDKGFNELLTSNDLKKAIEAFDKAFTFGFINNKRVEFSKNEAIVYAKKDFDVELLLDEDFDKLKAIESQLFEWSDFFENSVKITEELKTKNPSLHNYINWLSMRRKGHIFLKDYQKTVIPKIKQVLSIQETVSIKNNKGDEITGFIDLIAEMKDGKRYILDNKTSNMEYEPDSASKSQQLITYYHDKKIKYKLDGVGFIVLYKQINKNREKICSQCGHDGTGARHKTCNNGVEYDLPGIVEGGIDFKRCNGEWIETIKPETRIDIILNKVTEAAEDLIIETFDQANEGIKNKQFGPNPDSCMKFGQPCQFFKLCWEGKDDTLIKVESKDKK